MSAIQPHPLDAATALAGPVDAAVRTGRTSDGYWTFIGPFGGVSAATALRAALERPDRDGDPITFNFCAPIARGKLQVHTRQARANRSSQHWLVEFRQVESDEVVLTASIVTVVRCDSWSQQRRTRRRCSRSSRWPRSTTSDRCRGSGNTAFASPRALRR